MSALLRPTDDDEKKAAEKKAEEARAAGKTAHKPSPPVREARTLAIGTKLADFTVREAASDLSDPQPPTADVIIIRAGPGNPADAHFYTKACLEDSIARGIWDGVPCHVDHPTDSEDKEIPERSVESMAGYFTDAKLVTVTDDATHERVCAVSATFRPESGHEMVLRKLRTAAQYSQEHPNRSYIGFSINATGSGEPDTIDGREYDRVDQITGVTSVDIVTRAGAGGKLLTFKESYRMAKAAVQEKDTTEAAAAKPAKVAFSEAQAKLVAESFAKAGITATEAQITEAFASASNSADDGDEDDSALKIPDGKKTYEAWDDNNNPDSNDSKESSGDETEAKKEAGKQMPPWMEDDAKEGDKSKEDDEESSREAAVSMSVESMTRGQLQKFAKEALTREAIATKEAANAKLQAASAKREAAAAIQENATMKESARAAVSDLKTQLREGEARKIVENLGIPEFHRPRVLREMHRDGGKTRAGMLMIAEDYAATQLPSLGGGGAIIRESSVPNVLTIDCFAD